jgi:DNA-binding CsgD family transcriptional regulator
MAAGVGVLSEAINLARTAAERCSEIGRFAAEAICLQTAAQFGDGTCELRLRELEGLIEGPRAGVAARFAEALRGGEGSELELAASAFERIGDLVATVDAASQASIAFRRKDLRGSAIGAATRARALACECGADTPVLRQAREPLPLTDREREIALLLSQGMSNRDIAARLTLSIRTVENNVYKAMSKTGTGNRAELAALLGRRPLDASARPSLKRLADADGKNV